MRSVVGERDRPARWVRGRRGLRGEGAEAAVTWCRSGICRLQGSRGNPLGNNHSVEWKNPGSVRHAHQTPAQGRGSTRGCLAMASEIAALRARVQTLESENVQLASKLRKQESASRTMTESLQGELARIQHLCNELSYTMVLQGVDPSVLSTVTSRHLRFDPAVRTCEPSPHSFNPAPAPV